VLGNKEEEGWGMERGGGKVIETEKLMQQVEDLKNQVAREKKTTTILKKRAFMAAMKARSFRDIGVREEQEEHDVDTDQTSRVKNTFLEDVSHEIRSSMNGVVGMTSLVLETDLTEQQRQYMEMVSSSVDRLLGVVNQVLDYSKIESGQIDLKREDFELRESLDHDLYLLRLTAEKKDVELSCHISPNVPAYIHGDPERLIQVISNLVSNGIKFTTEGSVTIKIENDGYDINNNLQLKFTITDTGCGVDKKNRQLISRYFKQKLRHQASHPLIMGSTGLGLTVVSRLVGIMGGDVGLESGASGSTFWFRIPVQEVTDYRTVEEQGSKALEGIEKTDSYALKGAKVLLAEDEHINRVLIQTLLQQFDVEVTCVESGERAVEEGCNGGYDMLLMDVQLGEMDGLEATREIRKFEKKRGSHLPVVALTAMAMPGDREKCLQAGMDDYLSKPVERERLVDMLDKHLTSKALVVVSEVDSQQIIIRTLVESGWHVTIAETRRTAMYEASLSHFDLIVFDIVSPELKNLEAVKIIRELEEYSGQRATIMGVGADVSGEDCLDHGVDRYISGLLTQDKIEVQLASVQD
jgi:signal transduction histidine kinase/DNA-binding response OmpR family regulator